VGKKEQQVLKSLNVLTGVLLISTAHAIAGPIAMGDLMISLRNGTVREYTPTGTLVQTLSTGFGGEINGSGFDASGNFYVTAGFSGGGVVKFDSNANLVGNFGSGFSGHPESLVFDASGNMYVGQADSTHVVELSSTGPCSTRSLSRSRIVEPIGWTWPAINIPCITHRKAHT
jgi:hypothetical protein